MTLTLERTRQRLDGLVDRSLKGSSAELAMRELSVTRQIGPDIPEYSMDAELVGEALDTLIGESIKGAAVASRLRITVRSSRQALMFAVKSDCEGCSDVQREMLFTGEASTGTLARVLSIATAHGGMAWANGKQGKGMTFYFTLPTTTGPI